MPDLISLIIDDSKKTIRNLIIEVKDTHYFDLDKSLSDDTEEKTYELIISLKKEIDSIENILKEWYQYINTLTNYKEYLFKKLIAKKKATEKDSIIIYVEEAQLLINYFYKYFPKSSTSQIYCSTQSEELSKRCALCKKASHLTFECLNYPTRQCRIKRLNELNKCYLCLMSDHRSFECTSGNKCWVKNCNGRHNSIICPFLSDSITNNNV